MNTRARTGFSYVELIASLAIMSVLLAVSTQLLTLVASRMVADRKQRAAVESASNLLELITSQPFEEIGEQTIQTPAVRDLIDRSLSGWEIKVEVTDYEQPLVAKRIELVLVAQPEARPMTIMAWRHRGRAATP